MASIRLITGEDIRRFRKILKLTQKQLAEKAGVSQSLIARIEKKSVDPRLSTVKKIIEALTQTKKKRIATDIMHSPVITVDYRDPIRTVIERMKKHNISQIPVLKENKIFGSIRESTIVASIMKESNTEKVLESPVFHLMEKKFQSVSPSTAIDDVISLLSHGEPAVLVLDKNKLIGIITKIDAILSIMDINEVLKV